MPTITSAGVEFAEFLADVSDPGTGEIRSDRLALRLGVPEEGVIAHWRKSGMPWAAFAADVLGILDTLQDMTLSLSRSLAWYSEVPLLRGGAETASDYVARGRVQLALDLVKKLRRECTGQSITGTPDRPVVGSMAFSQSPDKD